MQERVKRPDAAEVNFKYDALGRRMFKESKGVRTSWLWDGNTPLHEWQATEEENIITWVFENGSFVPTARITDKGSQSIVTDYLGTPTQMYDANGNKTWEAQLDIYGRVHTFAGSSLSDCPFRYQGQYEDEETGLYYNRFRYYSPEEGIYLSQDPIRLNGGLSLYSYVNDTNGWMDIFGLAAGGSYYTVRSTNIGGQVHHIPANSVNGLSGGQGPSIWMSTSDHMQTRSWGNSANAQAYRTEQAMLIQQGDFSGAMGMDVLDITSVKLILI